MPAKLHLERVAREGTRPDHWLAITHGLLGAGMNWRAIARAIHSKRADWGVILIDLRNHGRSEGGEPPHSVAACANDVVVALAETGLPIGALAGHSFGGKVMLAARAAVAPLQTWSLDAAPSPRSIDPSDERNEAVRVLDRMERLPREWSSRNAFVQAIVSAGFSSVLANWLAMRVVASDQGRYVNQMDLSALRAMMVDYTRSDMWNVVLAKEPGTIDFIVGGKSLTVSEADRDRLRGAGIPVHVIPNADHWLHLDAPEAVVDLLVSRLP